MRLNLKIRLSQKSDLQGGKTVIDMIMNQYI